MKSAPTKPDTESIESEAEGVPVESLPDELAESLMKAAELHPNLVEFTRPELAARALMALSDGASVTATSRQTRLDRKTVRGLQTRHNDFLRIGRQESTRRAALIAATAGRVAMQRLALLDLDEATDEADRAGRVEALKKINPRDVLTAFGIAVDKVNVLEGPPVAAKPVDSGPTIADAQAALDRLREVHLEQERRVKEAVQREVERREDAAAKVTELSNGNRDHPQRLTAGR